MPNAPFVYPEIHESAAAGSIADLMLRKGDIAAKALQQVGQDVAAPIARQADPGVQLQQQQLDANKRAIGYQQTATKIAQSLVGPNGEQPTPDDASSLMTKSGIPVEFQQPILQSLTNVQNRHRENYADIAHAAYRTLQALPPEATDEDRRHAVAGTVGAFSAFGGISQDDITHVTQALAAGGDPKALAISFMGQSPTGRYKDLIQDETKMVSVGRGGIYDPSSHTVIGAPKTPPTEASLAADAATVGTPNETPTAKQSAAALAKLKPAPTRPEGLQALDAYAVSLGKTKAEDLTDAERQAFIQRDAKQKAAAAFAQHVQEHTYDVNHEAPSKPKSQDELEQESRQVLQREFSSRSGGLGVEDGKVNQARHLLALLNQYEGKNMPSQAYSELATGLASLIAPNGQIGIQMEQEFKQRTAQESLARGIAYLTGDPTLVNATPDQLRTMLRDSITRQGNVAQKNRQTYLNEMIAMLPTQLNDARRAAIVGSVKPNRLDPPLNAPKAGTVKNNLTWRDGDDGWGWYR